MNYVRKIDREPEPIGATQWQGMRDQDVGRLVAALEVLHAELAAHNDALTEVNRAMTAANAKLVRSRERYAALYQLAPTPLVTVDSAGEILETNDAGLALLANESPVGLTLECFVPRDQRAALEAVFHDVFSAGTRGGCELEIERPDGTRVATAVDAIATSDTPTGVAGCLISFVDITARRR